MSGNNHIKRSSTFYSTVNFYLLGRRLSCVMEKMLVIKIKWTKTWEIISLYRDTLGDNVTKNKK